MRLHWICSTCHHHGHIIIVPSSPFSFSFSFRSGRSVSIVCANKPTPLRTHQSALLSSSASLSTFSLPHCLDMSSHSIFTYTGSNHRLWSDVVWSVCVCGSWSTTNSICVSVCACTKCSSSLLTLDSLDYIEQYIYVYSVVVFHSESRIGSFTFT